MTFESKYNTSPIVIVGINNICKAVGIGKTTFYKWRRDEGFPAFKKNNKWRAVPEDIKHWMRDICHEQYNASSTSNS